MEKNNSVNILLVDDDPAQLLALEAVLESPGQVCVRANSGREALKHVLRTDFAVILLDVRMPDISGFDTARLIRDHPRASHVPIIFITASDDSAFPVEKAYALGAVDYLTKPLIPAVLRAKVAFFVDLYRKNQELARVERERHAAALSAKDERIHLILGNTKEYAFIVTDAHGRVTEWEGGAESITGWSSAEAIGHSTALIFTAEDRAAGCPQSEMMRARESDRAEDKRWYIRKDGTRFFANGFMVALKDQSGDVRGYTKIFHDATQERMAAEALQASEERYRTLFESIDDGFCIIEVLYDRDGKPQDYRFLEINPAFEEQTGLKDARGKTVRELVPGHDAHWFERYGRVAMTGEAVRFEEEAKAMGRWFNVYATRIGGADSHKIAILFTDITTRKRDEENLRRLASDLSAANRRKTEFLAILAHELRNPLAPIRSGLELMRLAGDNPATMERVREMMDRQLSHLVHLVDDLLDVARIAGNKLDLKKQRIELKSLVASAVETSHTLIESGGHVLAVDVPEESLILDADPTRIAQVIGNLLNNAAKYTPPGGRIELSACRIDGDAVISVSDTGIGIPQDALLEVFDMFTQVGRGVNGNHSGLGIGLSLVRRLVEQHGGTVTATSAGPGLGSTFTVRLPLADQPAPDSACGRAEGAGTTKRTLRVLIADDNRDAADSLAALLEHAGHTIRLASDGHQALEMAREFQPEIVFLDIGMPGMNGYEVARAFRQMQAGASAVLVALTGWGAEDDRARSREAGFNYHLTKPAALTEIDRLLATMAASAG